MHGHSTVVVPKSLAHLIPIHTEEDDPIVNMFLLHSGVESVAAKQSHRLSWVITYECLFVRLEVVV